ncbi:MAG: hypothetical protein M0P33_00990 [Massilibacteroides sp.]|nr:hypothetical protein [Massilibacteroides sp.]
MDNIDDWLYIVFLSIAGLIGLLGKGDKNKKKKGALNKRDSSTTNDPVDLPQQPSFLSDILKDIKNLQGDYHTEMEPQPKPKPEKRPSKIEPLSAKAYKPLQSLSTTVAQPVKTRISLANSWIKKETSFKPTTSKMKPNLTTNKEENEEDTFSLQDVRKAIIYSEIINAKYIQ